MSYKRGQNQREAVYPSKLRCGEQVSLISEQCVLIHASFYSACGDGAEAQLDGLHVRSVFVCLSRPYKEHTCRCSQLCFT